MMSRVDTVTATTARDEASSRRMARLPWMLLALAVLLVVVMVPLSVGEEPLFDTVFYGLLVLALGTTGAFVASRQPANPIGWIFCGQAIWGGVAETLEASAYHSLPTAEAGNWIIGWSWVVDLAAFVITFLLFPIGRLLTPRWRSVIWVLVAGCALGLPGQALSPDNPDNPLPVDSPVVEVMLSLGMLLLLSALIAAVASVVVRFRRATGVERLQLKQLVFAGSVLVPIMLLAIPYYYDSVAVQVAVALSFLALPVAAGLAILRYHLYDIDVVINKALVYAGLTATLAIAYLGCVLLFQLLLNAFTEGSSLAVAASTLAVAALFAPARTRIQEAVDRRFFRRRYDAVRMLEAFSTRLREELDIDALAGELCTAAAEAMQPSHVSLWLRKPKSIA
jgi:hypothetical protein